MNTSLKHRQLISGLLLVCSVVSLLLFFQLRYLPTPPGINGQALAAYFSGGHTTALQMYELFTGGVLERYPFWHFSSLVPAILVLTAGLAVWNYRLCRRQT